MYIKNFPENIINIACTIDNSYVQHCAVMLASLLDSNKNTFFKFYIIHNGMEYHKQRKLEKFLSKRKQCTYQLILIDQKYLAELPVNVPLFGHISIATYFRIFLAEILPNTLDKILFLDADIIVRKDIRPLWETNIEGYSHAATINPGLQDYFLNLYQEAANPYYFNAGVLLINLHFWRNNNIMVRAYNILTKYWDKIGCWDQDVLNILLNTNWLRVGLTWNATPRVFQREIKSKELMNHEEMNSLVNDPAIVHFAGGGFHKPWYYKCQHPFKNLYQKYLKHTPWSNSRLIGEPSLLLKLRMRLKLGTRLKKIISLRN